MGRRLGYMGTPPFPGLKKRVMKQHTTTITYHAGIGDFLDEREISWNYEVGRSGEKITIRHAQPFHLLMIDFGRWLEQNNL